MIQNQLGVSVREAAKMAGLGKDLLYAAISTGELKTAKVGARRIVLVEDLLAWLRSKMVVT